MSLEQYHALDARAMQAVEQGRPVARRLIEAAVPLIDVIPVNEVGPLGLLATWDALYRRHLKVPFYWTGADEPAKVYRFAMQLLAAHEPDKIVQCIVAFFCSDRFAWVKSKTAATFFRPDFFTKHVLANMPAKPAWANNGARGRVIN